MAADVAAAEANMEDTEAVKGVVLVEVLVGGMAASLVAVEEGRTKGPKELLPHQDQAHRLLDHSKRREQSVSVWTQLGLWRGRFAARL